MRAILSLFFYADGERYAAEAALVQKITRNMEISPVPTAPAAVAGIANLKGKVITLLCLASLLKRRGASGYDSNTANAVVFKPFAGEDDQMGLIIERPGDLIEIDDAAIVPPPLAQGEDAALYISGVAEVNGALYRILDIKSILDRFKNGGEPQGGIT